MRETQATKSYDIGPKQLLTYNDYRLIVLAFRDRIVEPERAIGQNAFCILRHDVEFSLARALTMAKIDAALGVKSTFYIQTRSNAYNAVSSANAAIIRKIKDLGIDIGLHLYTSHLADHDWAALGRELAFQSSILAHVLGEKITRFSTHRPSPWFLQARHDEISGMLNAYGPSFFEYTTDMHSRSVSFLTDSRRRWDYGHPLDHIKDNRVQLALHPDEWSVTGADTRSNFDALIIEQEESFLQTLRAECTHYSRSLSLANLKDRKASSKSIGTSIV